MPNEQGSTWGGSGELNHIASNSRQRWSLPPYFLLRLDCRHPLMTHVIEAEGACFTGKQHCLFLKRTWDLVFRTPWKSTTSCNFSSRGSTDAGHAHGAHACMHALMNTHRRKTNIKEKKTRAPSALRGSGGTSLLQSACHRGYVLEEEYATLLTFYPHFLHEVNGFVSLHHVTMTCQNGPSWSDQKAMGQLDMGWNYQACRPFDLY